ncbi:MAG TPA: fasciclin domain-containing protein [Croceibacterium sp.]|nr:fasciclin domain-containing protein [Croceibacterium sp.]
MEMTGLGRRHALVAAAATLLALAACSNEAEEGTGESTEVSDATLATLVAGDGDLSVVSSALSDAGLAQVFDGAAAYTILAPQDAAFDKLGEASADLRTPEQRPAMVAILRDHIVPGYFTPADIAKAIELDDDGKVHMKTMGNHTVTFSGTAEAITATAEDGATARLTGEPLRASNGVAIPLDGLLKATSGAPGAAAQ